MTIGDMFIDFNTEFLIRLFICLTLSIFIGIERQLRNGVVGLRTNILISTGTFFFVSAAYLFNYNELFRMASGVISGVGFIGAGLIIKEGCKIKGLDTAVTLWTSSSIGVLCGCNLLIEAIYATLMILFANIIIRKIIINSKNNNKLLDTHTFILKIGHISTNSRDIRQLILNTINSYSLNIISLDSYFANNHTMISCHITSNFKNVSTIEEILKEINNNEFITSIGWSNDESKDL